MMYRIFLDHLSFSNRDTVIIAELLSESVYTNKRRTICHIRANLGLH